MLQKEKLIELLNQYRECQYDEEIDCNHCEYKDVGKCIDTRLADYLLTNGVVVLPCRCCECEHCDIGQNDAEQWCVCQVKRVDVDTTDFCSHAKRKGGVKMDEEANHGNCC